MPGFHVAGHIYDLHGLDTCHFKLKKVYLGACPGSDFLSDAPFSNCPAQRQVHLHACADNDPYHHRLKLSATGGKYSTMAFKQKKVLCALVESTPLAAASSSTIRSLVLFSSVGSVTDARSRGVTVF